MQDFRKITAWQKAHQLALRVYAITSRFPAGERFGLSSQMRRAAVSIAANIVEGRSRGGDKEYRYFSKVALGSAGKLEYYVLLASDLSLLEDSDRESLSHQIVEIKRMLAGLIRTLSSQNHVDKSAVKCPHE